MKFRTFLNIIVSIILLATYSCSKKNDYTLQTLNFDEARIISPDKLVDSLKVFPLEMVGDKYPFGIKNLIAYQDHIIIFDHKDIIFVYSSDGKYISDSHKSMGKGNGEYTNVTAVSFNKYNNTIEVATPSNLLIYDLNFHYIGSTDLPTKLPDDNDYGIFIGTIHDISSHEHLLIPICFSDDFRQIYNYDSSTGKLNGKINFGDVIFANTTMQSQCFSRLTTDTLLFFPPGISKFIYTFNYKTNELEEYLHLNFGSNGVSEEDLKQFSSDDEGLRNYIMKTEKTVPLMAMNYKDKILLVTKNGPSFKNGNTIIWNPKTGNAYRLDTFVNGKPSFPIFDYVDDNGIYTILDSDTYQDIIDRITPEKVNINSLDIPDGSHVLLKFKLKDNI